MVRLGFAIFTWLDGKEFGYIGMRKDMVAAPYPNEDKAESLQKQHHIIKTDIY